MRASMTCSTGTAFSWSIHLSRKRQSVKNLIDGYYRLLSESRIPNRTKFPHGIFDIPLNKMKVNLAILRDLPYALEGIFGQNNRIVETFVLLNEYYSAARAVGFTNSSITALEDLAVR